MIRSGKAPLPGPLFIYGAYGTTGAMIARVAVARGHDVVLSGSDRDRLARLSAEMGVPGVPVRLEDQAALRRVIRPAACVIHVAGPFATTFRPMLEACSAEAVPYLDLNGELDVFRAMEDFVDQQRPAIPVVSGVGFGVVAGESAAMHAAGMLGQPRRVWLGLVPDLGMRSQGAAASAIRAVARGGAVVENGQFVPERVGRRSFTATIAGRKETFISMPLGELWAVRRSTAVSTVVAGAARPLPERLLLQSGGLRVLAQSEKIRRWLIARLARDGAQTQNGRVFESTVWARAEDREGRTAEAVLQMGEGYQWSAEAAVRAAEQVAVDRRAGLWTPGQYLGKEFALGVPSTKLLEFPAGVSL
jgi:saccharopine dehydrogenase (NAD+, L-lysine-forming)